jgi:hypothetical protein
MDFDLAGTKGVGGVCRNAINCARMNRVRVRTSFIKENTQ